VPPPLTGAAPAPGSARPGVPRRCRPCTRGTGSLLPGHWWLQTPLAAPRRAERRCATTAAPHSRGGVPSAGRAAAPYAILQHIQIALMPAATADEARVMRGRENSICADRPTANTPARPRNIMNKRT
jgi:hypothetical protein